MAREGITAAQVTAVIQGLAGQGKQITIKAIREALGTGSPNTSTVISSHGENRTLKPYRRTERYRLVSSTLSMSTSIKRQRVPVPRQQYRLSSYRLKPLNWPLLANS